MDYLHLVDVNLLKLIQLYRRLLKIEIPVFNFKIIRKQPCNIAILYFHQEDINDNPDYLVIKRMIEISKKSGTRVKYHTSSNLNMKNLNYKQYNVIIDNGMCMYPHYRSMIDFIFYLEPPSSNSINTYRWTVGYMRQKFYDIYCKGDKKEIAIQIIAQKMIPVIDKESTYGITPLCI